MILNVEEIRVAARAGRVKWRYHGLVRASQRGISRDQVFHVMQEGHIVEEHPRSKPLPKCLMMAILERNKPLYVSLGYDSETEYIYIITTHWLDPRKWEDPWTRKSKQTKLSTRRKP